MINARTLSLACIIFIGLSQGCAMVQTYPLAARAGDTITISPGSLDGATTSNLTIQYYSDTNPAVPINLTSHIRSVFNITPDRTSPAWTDSFADSIPPGSGHGPWQTVVAVNLPASGLPEGPGNVRISLGAGVTVPDSAQTPEGVNMALTILPGSGAPNPFEYLALPGNPYNWTGDLSQLKPGKQYVIKPMPAEDGEFRYNKYAAAEFTLNMPIRYFDDESSSPPNSALVDYLRVVLDPHPELDAYQVNLAWRRDGDNIIVSVISPLVKISFRQIRFSVVISSNENLSNIKFFGPASITGVKYYDVNGNVVSTTPIHALQDMTI